MFHRRGFIAVNFIAVNFIGASLYFALMTAAVRPGLFSVDTWTLIAIYLRNLLFNWTVFLRLIAMFLMLPQLYLTFVNIELNSFSQYFIGIFIILGFLVIPAGITAVTYIIAMRPTLIRFSWMNQQYKIDDIGTVISAEAKVRRWCLSPLIAAAFGINVCLIWAGDFLFKRFPDSAVTKQLEEFPEIAKLLSFVVFYEFLFLGGFIVAHTLLRTGARGGDKNTGAPDVKIFKEFGWSALSGALGGAHLYLFAISLPRVVEALEIDEPNKFYVCFGPSVFLITVLLSATFFVGVASHIYDDMDREWLSRFGAWILIVIVGWSVLSCAVLFGPKIFEPHFWKNLLGLNYGGEETGGLITGLLSVVGGASGLITLILGFSRKSPASEEKETKSTIDVLIKLAPQIAAPIFGLFLIILISHGISLLVERTQGLAGAKIGDFSAASVMPQNAFFYWLFWFAAFGLTVWQMGYLVNINKFSLHAMYRERLISAYLGASRTDKRLETANSFTDLDGTANVEMHKLSRQKPFHVVNMTLNLGKSNNLRWQNRKAESFTATAVRKMKI